MIINYFILIHEIITEAMIEHGKKVKAIILNYSLNPTLITYFHKEMVIIEKELSKYDNFVLFDKIYLELI
jgi:aminotransferase